MNVSSKHLPALDGLRGLAIVLVMLFHTFYTAPQSGLFDLLVAHAASTGWVGVDLFFVLSGFLITGILIDAKGSSNYMLAFYGRRVLRIVPAYVVFVFFALYAAPSLHVETVGAAQQMRQIQWWYWSYSVNILIAIRGWAAAPTASHLWSLAVEEQFYLLWPAIVLISSMRGLLRITIGCFVGAELVRIAFVLAGLPREAGYVSLPSRMDTLATGAFLACALRTPGLWERVVRWRKIVAIVASVVILVIVGIYHLLDFHRPSTQLIAFPFLALLSGALVSWATEAPRWMSAASLRFFGQYSYAMYLWHSAVILFVVRMLAGIHFPTLLGSHAPYYVVLLTSVIVATTLVALLSWYAVERPCLRLKRYVVYQSAPRTAHAESYS